MSLVLRELGEADALMPLAAAVAVCEACEEFIRPRCSIKWPNDVWIGERKVAGILIEARPQDDWAVLGIGVNVDMETHDFPPELRESATSLRLAAGPPAPRPESVLAALLRALERRTADEPQAVLEAWRDRDALRGRRVRWDSGEGAAAGIDESGAMLVDTDSGRVRLEAGEVHLLG